MKDVSESVFVCVLMVKIPVELARGCASQYLTPGETEGSLCRTRGSCARCPEKVAST